MPLTWPFQKQVRAHLSPSPASLLLKRGLNFTATRSTLSCIMIHKFPEAETKARSVAGINWHSSTDSDTELHHLTCVCFSRHHVAIQATIKWMGHYGEHCTCVGYSKGTWGMNLAQYFFGWWGNCGSADKQYVFCLFFYQYLDRTCGGVFESFLLSKVVFYFWTANLPWETRSLEWQNGQDVQQKEYGLLQ